MGATIFEKPNVNDPRTEGELAMLALFRNSPRFDGWTYFEEPHINGLKPDAIAFHPEKGVLIIEIKDYQLSSDTYLPNGRIKGTDGRIKEKNPVKQVERYKDSIMKTNLRTTIELSNTFDDDFYSCFETIVYFHCATEQQANEFCGYTKYTKIWTQKHLAEIEDERYRLSTKRHAFALASYRPSKFSQHQLLEQITKELSAVLGHSDYQTEHRTPIQLTKTQLEAVQIKQGSTRRMTGVAGSGKTLVTVEKALAAHEQQQRVLLVTYNITLRHYIRDLCVQQYQKPSHGLFKNGQLHVMYFHELLKNMLTEYNIKLDIDSDDSEEDFTAQWMQKIKQAIEEEGLLPQFQYDTILVDEGQDFKSEWVRFFKVCGLYSTRGELFVAYDRAQDLYEHGVWLEDAESVKGLGFRGRPAQLKLSYRIPEALVGQIEQMKRLLHIEGDTLTAARQSQLSMFASSQFFNVQAETIEQKTALVAKVIAKLRQTNQLDDITILTTNEHTGAEIVKHLDSLGIPLTHVYDIERNKNQKFRKKNKWKFYSGHGLLKICSYHSYKGWETPNILLVLDPPTTNYDEDGRFFCGNYYAKQITDALFISMSRVKAKLNDGSYQFICLNYLEDPTYQQLSTLNF